MYLVVFYEDCVGFHFYDEKAKLFNDKNSAIRYADTLNNHCDIKDLGDYYDIIFVPIG